MLTAGLSVQRSVFIGARSEDRPAVACHNVAVEHTCHRLSGFDARLVVVQTRQAFAVGLARVLLSELLRVARLARTST